MSISSLTKRSDSALRDPVYPQLPSPLYGLTIVSLAVFFAGLIIWRVPVEAYLIVSEVGRRAVVEGSPATQSADFVFETRDGQQMASIRQALADAIRYADARLANTEPDCSTAVREERLQSVGRRLRISAHRIQNSDHGISISFAGQNPAWSLALVENLTRECLVSGGQLAAAPAISSRLLRDARWRVEQARHYERKARFEMEDMIDAQLANRSGTEESGVNGKNSESEFATSGAELDTEPAPEPNPQWLYLQNELANMTSQLQSLLSQLTPNHPQIRDLTLQMETVRHQLDQTPQYVAPQVSLAIGSAPTAGNPPSTETSLAAHKLDIAGAAASAGGEGAGGEYAKERETHERAVRAREEVEQQLATLMAQQATHAPGGNVESRWLITPPSVQGRIGGRPSAGRVGAIGLFALLCGVSMAWSVGTLKGLRRLNSVADLELTLSIPVVGQLSIDPVPQAVLQLTRRSQFLRGITWVVEASLVLMLIGFLVGVLDGSSVSPFLRQDPFATIPETIVRAVQTWF
ncbi:MAG: hypothetical protein ACYC3X_15085 [Pirellulaceae bacterium]